LRIAPAGSFADEVAGALAAALGDSRSGGGRRGSARVIAILDSFDPDEARRLQADDGALPLLLCFLTRRGLFVSSWLHSSGPCLLCFARRWDANLAFWEHDLEQERSLRALERHSPGLRSFPVPATAVALAAAIILDRVEGREPGLCRYADLVSAESATGRLAALDGCPRCRRDGSTPSGRYVRGLEAVADRLAL
jgi:hypothetical protein